LEWSADEKTHWAEVREAVAFVLSSRDLTLSAKALDLIFDFEKFCLNSRIITDIRPVFDDERNRIVGGIVMHTLRIEYRADDGRHKTISIELDDRDIERLAHSCMDANKKMEKAKDLIQNQLRLPFITAAEGIE